MTKPAVSKSDILLHLAECCIPNDGYNGTYALTAKGIADAFGLNEKTASYHIYAMIADGTICPVPLHVPGLPANRPTAVRTKCYFLTPKGWEVVRGCVYGDRVQQPGQVPVR